MLLVHGFGGNADHWRKNTPALAARGHRAYAIDLLGYGYSDKPDPRGGPPNTIYTFDTWGAQLADFAAEVVGGPAFVSCNSVGGALCTTQQALLIIYCHSHSYHCCSQPFLPQHQHAVLP